jgi:hypothetical protein
MAGQMPLEHPVVVQIHCPQPLKPPFLGRFRFKRLSFSTLVPILLIRFIIPLRLADFPFNKSARR